MLTSQTFHQRELTTNPFTEHVSCKDVLHLLTLPTTGTYLGG